MGWHPTARAGKSAKGKDMNTFNHKTVFVWAALRGNAKAPVVPCRVVHTKAVFCSLKKE